jgi:undecaprenyl pyrophosphate phosphatase UppP
MTLFQAIITAIIGVFSEIFPVAAGAHRSLLEYFLGWNVSNPRLIGATEFGLFLGMLITLRHDILSHISSFLQVIIYRKKPMAMDERMPIFILTGVVVPMLAFVFFRQNPILPSENPYLFAAVLALSGIPMAFLDNYTKKNKSIYDWNALDAALVGIGSAALAVPEIGRLTGAFTISALRNYSREGAGKFILYIATPVMALSAWYDLRGPGATLAVSDFPKLYFYVVLIVSTLASLFAVHVFLSQLKTITLMRYAVYRVILAAAVIGFHLYSVRAAP